MSLAKSAPPKEKLRTYARVVLAACFVFLAVSFALPHAARAAIRFVQSDSGECSNCPSFAFSFPSNNIPGNTIIVGFDWRDTGGNFSSISDSQGNIYTQAGVESRFTPAGASEKLRVYYASNIKGGANTVTVTLGGQTDWLNVYIHEYSGIASTAPLDVTATSTGTGTALTSGSVTTNAANELIFGYGINDINQNVSPGTGFANRSTFCDQSGCPAGDITEDKTVASAGSYAATASIPISADWLMRIVTFKPTPQIGEILMASSTPAIATGRVKYRLSVPPSQAAGTYTNLIIYTIIPAY